MLPRVSIIILNWNGWKDTIECLESLYRINYPNYDVIIIDNGSKDDSVEKIKDYARGKIKVSSKFFDYNPENKPIMVFEISEEEAKRGKFNKPHYDKYDPDRRLILIKNKKNHGFAGGNNIGMKFALSVLNPEYILLLNNDTIVTPSFLRHLVESAKDENVGSVQALLLRPDFKTVDSLGQELSTLGAEDSGMGSAYTPLENDLEVFGACAASALYQSKALLLAGLFDESFFILHEDVDLSWRLRLSGYKSILSHNSIVLHRRGISESPEKKKRKGGVLLYYGRKNSIRVYIRYHPFLSFKDLVIVIYGIFRESLYWGKKGMLLQFIRDLKEDIVLRGHHKKNPALREIHSRWIKQEE
ncbi:glycosyltransferase family 2 protein [Thermococcus sp.]